MNNVMIGIDLGGTNLRIWAVTPDNEMKNPYVIKSFYIANAHSPVKKLCEIIEKYRVSNGIEDIDCLLYTSPSPRD